MQVKLLSTTLIYQTQNRSRRSSVNFGGKDIENYVQKINKMPNFTWYLPEKYFPEFFGGEGWGTCPRLYTTPMLEMCPVHDFRCFQYVYCVTTNSRHWMRVKNNLTFSTNLLNFFPYLPGSFRHLKALCVLLHQPGGIGGLTHKRTLRAPSCKGAPSKTGRKLSYQSISLYSFIKEHGKTQDQTTWNKYNEQNMQELKKYKFKQRSTKNCTSASIKCSINKFLGPWAVDYDSSTKLIYIGPTLRQFSISSDPMIKVIWVIYFNSNPALTSLQKRPFQLAKMPKNMRF